MTKGLGTGIGIELTVLSTIRVRTYPLHPPLLLIWHGAAAAAAAAAAAVVLLVELTNASSDAEWRKQIRLSPTKEDLLMAVDAVIEQYEDDLRSMRMSEVLGSLVFDDEKAPDEHEDDEDAKRGMALSYTRARNLEAKLESLFEIREELMRKKEKKKNPRGDSQGGAVSLLFMVPGAFWRAAFGRSLPGMFRELFTFLGFVWMSSWHEELEWKIMSEMVFVIVYLIRGWQELYDSDVFRTG